MGASTLPEPQWTDFQDNSCVEALREPEEILRRMGDTFAQVNIAADFLLMKTDPDSTDPEPQLICLIKERLVSIQDQVMELYTALDQQDSGYPILRQ